MSLRPSTLPSDLSPYLARHDPEKEVLILTVKDSVASLCFLENDCGVLFYFVLCRIIQRKQTEQEMGYLSHTFFFFF